MTADVSAAVEHAHRAEWGRVLAGLARITGDVDVAEEATADAFVAALETWPAGGVPANPGAWLATTARRKALDRLRRDATYARKLALLAVESDLTEAEVVVPTSIRDDRLQLVFAACHPALALDAQVALTLRWLSGLTTEEIAAGFLVPTATMAQRLVRAKRKVWDAAIPLRLPPDHELPERLPAVLAVVYLVYNAGYVATGGDSLTRGDLCTRALDLARTVAELMPDEGEALGLLALLRLQEARRPARVDAAGDLVLLEDQDRSQWDASAVAEGCDVVARAVRRKPVGPYAIQAAIAAVHAEAPTYAVTDWPEIVSLYDLLMRVSPSPVVALNRAVAVAMVDGWAAGLALMDGLSADLDGYHYLHAGRADLLRRLQRRDEAAVAYDRALALCANPAERAFLTRRRAEVAPPRGG